jgi:hypothetical protein
MLWGLLYYLLIAIPAGAVLFLQSYFYLLVLAVVVPIVVSVWSKNNRMVVME